MSTTITFEDIRFESAPQGVRAHFLGHYTFELKDEDLQQIGPYTISEGTLIFEEREKRVWNKFNLLLEQGLSLLTHKVRNKPCLYIHAHLGLPLIGTNEFGLVDRGSNIIEVKPLTGCNLSCTFCSVSEGENKKIDLLVEKDYLLEEFKALCAIKEHEVEANIGPQGEPLLYPQLLELIAGLKRNGAAVVSINTNGTLLNPAFIEKLAAAGLDRINLSVHTLDQAQANNLMGGIQDLQRLRKNIAACNGIIDVLLAPVLIPGVNDEKLDDIIELSKTIHNKRWPAIGIQNFLDYPGGRNPGVKERTWEDFYKILKDKEQQHGLPLTLRTNNNPFNIHKDKTLPKPFKKGDLITAQLVIRGRNENEWLATAQKRTITVRNCQGKSGQQVTLQLLRDKHNIYTALMRRNS